MLLSTDTILKYVMIAGIFGYLLLLEYDPKKRDLYLYPALEILLFVAINLFVWEQKLVSLSVLVGFDLLGVLFIFRGFKEYKEDNEGREQLRHFEKMHSTLVKAIMNKQQIILVLQDNSEHLFTPDKLVKCGAEIFGFEDEAERQYLLEDVKEVRERG